ncbi:MAG: hypothetical protein IH903_04000, partial [Proteobacteria bacterium]|nr:hypothetical protein [Pseudomonadota bacterium]
LNAAAANVSFVEIESDQGHDSFLLDIPEYHNILSGFLAGAADHLVRCGAKAPSADE